MQSLQVQMNAAFVALILKFQSVTVTRVANVLLCSEKLYCPFDQLDVAVARAGANNAVNTRQSETDTLSLLFPPLRLHAFNANVPTYGYFVHSPLLLASRDQDVSLSNSPIDISLKNRGL